MTPPTIKSLSPLSWPKRHKLFTLLILIAAIVAGIFVYEKVALELNKRTFTQARASIDTVYADVVTKVGPPDNSKRVNSCNRSNQEFEQGPLTCDVGASFIYGVSNLSEAEAILGVVQKSVSGRSDLLRTTAPLTGNISSTLIINSYYQTAHDYYQTGDHMNCEASYIYDTPRETDLTIKDLTKKPFEISFGCSGAAKAQYYPLD